MANNEFKKPSNFFEDMENVKRYAESIKGKVPTDIYNDILMLLGLEENRAITSAVVIDGVEVKIDKYISELVAFLNGKGIKTLACCSGLQEEHENSIHKPVQGYMAIEFNADYFEYLFNHFCIEGVTIKTGEVFFKPCISFVVKADSDEGLKSLWDKLYEFFQK